MYRFLHRPHESYNTWTEQTRRSSVWASTLVLTGWVKHARGWHPRRVDTMLWKTATKNPFRSTSHQEFLPETWSSSGQRLDGCAIRDASTLPSTPTSPAATAHRIPRSGRQALGNGAEPPETLVIMQRVFNLTEDSTCSSKDGCAKPKPVAIAVSLLVYCTRIVPVSLAVPPLGARCFLASLSLRGALFSSSDCSRPAGTSIVSKQS